MTNHDSIQQLQFFRYKHLPEHLAAVSKEFHDLAVAQVLTLPDNEQANQCLHYLLLAKDCAVRAKLYDPQAITVQTLSADALAYLKKSGED